MTYGGPRLMKMITTNTLLRYDEAQKIVTTQQRAIMIAPKGAHGTSNDEVTSQLFCSDGFQPSRSASSKARRFKSASIR